MANTDMHDDAPLTRGWLPKLYAAVGEQFSKAMLPLLKRVKAADAGLASVKVQLDEFRDRLDNYERRNIDAHSRTADALVALATAQQENNRLLAAPMVGIRDSTGRMVAARRQVPDAPGDQGAELRSLRDQVAKLEARPLMQYVGTWAESDNYGSQEVVTYDGSMWVCRVASTRAKPGTSEDWQLAVRKGLAAR